MQRPIKFRAWHIGQKKMYTDIAVLACPDELYRVYDSYAQEEYIGNDKYLEIMQFTGLKDKNGKEIYEGDILKFEPKVNFLPVGHDGTAQMYWYADNDHAGYWIKDGGDFDYSIDILCGQDYEVIGNIMENPELLK